MIDGVLAASLRVGFDTLRANPLRTLLSTLGIIMGVGALVSVLSLGDGMERYARDQIERTTDLQTINVSPSVFRMVDGQRFPRTDVIDFTFEDADSLSAALRGGATVALLVTGAAIVTTETDTMSRAATVVGTMANVAAELPAPVVAGRFLSEREGRTDARVVVLGAALADRLAGDRAPASLVGSNVIIQGTAHRVVGVLGPAGGSSDALAFMPVAAARHALPPALVGRPTTIAVRVDRVEDAPAVRRDVEAWLAGRYGAAWSERVSVASNESRVAQAQQGMLLFKLFMGALTGISLLVGGIGIMNVLLASVAERTREIGIRKATGARHRHILLQFLSESVAIAVAGSLIGVLLGIAAAFGATQIMRSITSAPIYAGFSFGTLFIAIGASAAVGLAFGLYPALRAARLSPVEAIHHE